MTAVVMVPLILALLSLLDAVKVKLVGSPRRQWLIRAALIGNAVLLLCAIDAWYVEPGRLTVTRIAGTSPKIAVETGGIKIVQISDVHFVRRTALTSRVLSTIGEEKPDLIFLTGDVYQPTGFDEREFGDFLTRLTSIAPVYAVMGFDDKHIIRKASNGRVHILDRSDAKFRVRGTNVMVVGTDSSTYSDNAKSDPARLVFLLTHTSDSLLSHMQLDLGPNTDWAFAGHTHGGQVRIPMWGAVCTGCDSGKRYEYGLYRFGTARLFVSRGVGMEPHAPQVRFLCPPEIVVLTLARGT